MMSIKIEELLERDGKILELPVGTSMWPMLKNRLDPLVIEKVSGNLKNNDVVLFKRNDGQYVLHRIVKIKEEGYIIRGDNCYDNEFVSDKQIIGVLRGFYKGERYIDCKSNFLYKMYVMVWRLSYHIRFCIKKLI